MKPLACLLLFTSALAQAASPALPAPSELGISFKAPKGTRSFVMVYDTGEALALPIQSVSQPVRFRFTVTAEGYEGMAETSYKTGSTKISYSTPTRLRFKNLGTIKKTLAPPPNRWVQVWSGAQGVLQPRAFKVWVLFSEKPAEQIKKSLRPLRLP